MPPNACRLCRRGSWVYNERVFEVKKEIPDHLHRQYFPLLALTMHAKIREKNG